MVVRRGQTLPEDSVAGHPECITDRHQQTAPPTRTVVLPEREDMRQRPPLGGRGGDAGRRRGRRRRGGDGAPFASLARRGRSPPQRREGSRGGWLPSLTSRPPETSGASVPWPGGLGGNRSLGPGGRSCY